MSSNNIGQYAVPQPQTIIVKNKSNTGKYLLFGTLGCFALMLCSCLGLMFLDRIVGNTNNKSNSSESTPTSADKKQEVILTDEQINQYATTYCDKRDSYKQLTFPVLKLKDATKPFTHDNVENSTSKEGNKLTINDCKNTIRFIYEYYKEQGDNQGMVQQRIETIVVITKKSNIFMGII